MWRCAVAGVLVSGFVSIPAAETQAQEDNIWETQVKLQTPRKKPPRQGGPLDAVELAIWIPEGVDTVRGAVVNPFYVDAVRQSHWRAAAKHWRFAIIGANYSDVKLNDFPTLLTALKQFGNATGRKEIEHLPLCFVGMSAGAGMSMRFTELMPDRVIAAAPVCLEVGPRSEASCVVPTITVFGEKDGKQMEKLQAKLPEWRAKQAQWAIAVQWRRRHEFGQANNLVMPFFDAVIRDRYPVEATPLKGPVKLRNLDEKRGWVGDVSTWESNAATVQAVQDARGALLQAAWLPNAYVAHVWQAFVSQNPTIKIDSPASTGDKKPLSVFAFQKPVNVKVSLKGQLEVKKVDIYSGDKRLGTVADEHFDLEVKNLPPGFHALIAVASMKDGRKVVSRPHTILVQTGVKSTL